MDPKAQRVLAPPQHAFKYWLHHQDSLRTALRASAKAEAEKNPTGPHKDTLFDHLTKKEWERVPEDQREKWAAAAATGGPPPGQASLPVSVARAPLPGAGLVRRTGFGEEVATGPGGHGPETQASDGDYAAAAEAHAQAHAAWLQGALHGAARQPPTAKLADNGGWGHSPARAADPAGFAPAAPGHGHGHEVAGWGLAPPPGPEAAGWGQSGPGSFAVPGGQDTRQLEDPGHQQLQHPQEQGLAGGSGWGQPQQQQLQQQQQQQQPQQWLPAAQAGHAHPQQHPQQQQPAGQEVPWAPWGYAGVAPQAPAQQQWQSAYEPYGQQQPQPPPQQAEQGPATGHGQPLHQWQGLPQWQQGGGPPLSAGGSPGWAHAGAATDPGQGQGQAHPGLQQTGVASQQDRALPQWHGPQGRAELGATQLGGPQAGWAWALAASTVAPVAQVPNPLFPLFQRAEGAAALPNQERYTRWLRLLPDGSMPTDAHIVHWLRTWPIDRPPLSASGSTWRHIKSNGQPTGILFQGGGKKGGAVTVYLATRTPGKVHIAANVETRELLLGKVMAWTQDWNGGQRPAVPLVDAAGAPVPLPPLPA